MPDPRTDLYNVLSRRLTEEMVARDEAWADYWQRRRVVVVPDGEPMYQQSVQETAEYQTQAKAREQELNQKIDSLFHSAGFDRAILSRCIARLKAAREKESVNKNLSTLLAVVVKVQRDLEALLNGADNG